eukprot:gene21461-27278_t
MPPPMTASAFTAADLSADIARVFALQQAHQWEAKASTAAQRKDKLARLKSVVEAHAEAIIAAVLEDTRKPVTEIRVTEVLNVTANIQRNIDNLDAWMRPTEVTPSLNPADRAQILYEARRLSLPLAPRHLPLRPAPAPAAPPGSWRGAPPAGWRAPAGAAPPARGAGRGRHPRPCPPTPRPEGGPRGWGPA